MKKLAITVLSLLLCFSVCGCSTPDGFMKDDEIKELEENIKGTITLSFTDDNSKEQSIPMTFELYYDKAPITVTNFVKLVNDGFYNGTYCQNYNNTDNSEYLNIEPYEYELDSDTQTEILVQKEKDYYIKGEFSENGWDKNDTEHNFGTFSMIREEGFDTASAAFMISLSEEGFDSRNDNYAAFGKIISVDSKFFTYFKGFYYSLDAYDFKIESITIDNLDVDLGELLTIEK